MKKCFRCKTQIEDDLDGCAACVDKVNRGIQTIPPFYREHLKLDIAKNMCGQMKDVTKPFLTFLGAAGTGKSLSAARTARSQSLKSGEVLHWQNCAELLMDIRATFKDKAIETEDEVIKRMAAKELLVLDDLASEKVSDYSISTLYIILNHRGEYGLTTIVTSNLSLRQIAEQLGTRIADRLSRYGEIVTLEAQ